MASIAPLPPPPPPESPPPALTAGDPPATAAATAAGGAQTRSATLSRSALASQRSLGVSLLWPVRPPPADLGGPSNSPAHPVPLPPADDWCAAAVAAVVPADSGGAFLRDRGCRVDVPGTEGAAGVPGAVGPPPPEARAADGVAAVAAEEADTTSLALRAWSSWWWWWWWVGWG